MFESQVIVADVLPMFDTAMLESTGGAAAAGVVAEADPDCPELFPAESNAETVYEYVVVGFKPRS